MCQPGEHRALLPAQHRPDFGRREGAQLLHREDLVEAGPERLHLFPDARFEGELQGQAQVVVQVGNVDFLVLAVGHEVDALQQRMDEVSSYPEM